MCFLFLSLHQCSHCCFLSPFLCGSFLHNLSLANLLNKEKMNKCRQPPLKPSNGNPYTAPSFLSTAPTVFHSILRSFPKFQFSIYSRSSFTTSSKSVMLLRPLICHIPVMPGFMESLVQCLSSYCSTSETRGGLVPTREISPLSTLKNCGNSSMLQSRMKLPIPFL